MLNEIDIYRGFILEDPVYWTRKYNLRVIVCVSLITHLSGFRKLRFQLRIYSRAEYPFVATLRKIFNLAFILQAEYERLLLRTNTHILNRRSSHSQFKSFVFLEHAWKITISIRSGKIENALLPFFASSCIVKSGTNHRGNNVRPFAMDEQSVINCSAETRFS